MPCNIIYSQVLGTGMWTFLGAIFICLSLLSSTRNSWKVCPTLKPRSLNCISSRNMCLGNWSVEVVAPDVTSSTSSSPINFTDFSYFCFLFVCLLVVQSSFLWLLSIVWLSLQIGRLRQTSKINVTDKKNTSLSQ